METLKIGKAGNGTKTHVVSVFTRPDDGTTVSIIVCGAEQFNGSGNGSLNRLQDLDLTKVSCKRCLKKHSVASEPKLASHIDFLLKAEKLSTVSLMWNRTSDNTLTISTVGYKHMEFYEVLQGLMKLGCKYDFDKGIEVWDPQCGRTFSHIKEPKKG